MEVEYSDGSRVSISSLEREEYRLVVETERPGVVAFAPQNEPRSQPRVIAVAAGSGNLLAVTLAPPLACTLSPQTILAHTHAHVRIIF